MSAHEHIPWTDDERTQLRRLHDNGLSQRAIALLMGRSKNSINRQCHRLHLFRANPVRQQPQADTPVKAQRVGRGASLPPLASLIE